MEDLKNKTIIITGASSGYGQGAAFAFAKEGCNLLLIARREDRLRETTEQCRESGATAVYYVGDVREEKTATESIKMAIDYFGKIDILINNAGIGRMESIEKMSMEEYDLIMETNVRSAFAFSKYAVPEMLKYHDGQIIMVSSVTDTWGHAFETAYTASKFALRGLGQALDQELASKGIRTCVFSPHAGSTEFELGHGRDINEWKDGKEGLLTAQNVGEALVSICKQNKNSRIVELQLTGYKSTWY